MAWNTREQAAAAGNCAHRYIGKVCCLLLVQADYIPAAPPGAFQRARGIAQAVTALPGEGRVGSGLTRTSPKSGGPDRSTPKNAFHRRNEIKLRRDSLCLTTPAPARPRSCILARAVSWLLNFLNDDSDEL